MDCAGKNHLKYKWHEAGWKDGRESIKQEILEKLPKVKELDNAEKYVLKMPNTAKYIVEKIGFNSCLKEIKSLIKEL